MRFIFSFPLFTPASLPAPAKAFQTSFISASLLSVLLQQQHPHCARWRPSPTRRRQAAETECSGPRVRGVGCSGPRPGSLVPTAPVMDSHLFRKSLQALVTATELLKQREIWASLL